MPNMLAHIGVQTLVTRAVIRGADVKWIWAGCVIPDLPWIGQRMARAVAPETAFLDIRLYAIVQASFLFCLILSAALACLSDRPRRVFAILALGCLMHLLLDALQTKWANGVHFFAPMSWDLVNFGLFWPEDPPTWALTALGLIVAGYAFWRLRADTGDLIRPGGVRLGALFVLVSAYLAGPLTLMHGPLTADNHFAATLADTENRTGRTIGFDRRPVLEAPGGPVLDAWTGERIALAGAGPETPGTYSLTGIFQAPDAIEVSTTHAHPKGLRDIASYLGLLLILAWWGRCLLRPD